MLTKQDYLNLAAILSTAKFDNLTIPAAAVAVVLLDKIQKLAQEPNGNADSSSSNQSSSDKPSEQHE